MLIVSIAVFPTQTAEAKSSKLATPQLSEYAVYGDRLVISVDNYKKYPSNAKLKFFVGSTFVKAVYAKDCEKVYFSNDGNNFFKTDTAYRIYVRAVIPGDSSRNSEATSIKLKTSSKTYFKLSTNTQIYKYSGGKMKAVKKSTESGYVTGVVCTAKGASVTGRSAEKYKGEYVRLGSGSYKGYYISTKDTSRCTEVKAKRSIVSQYGKSMDGGRYVYGGTTFKNTDCSGLTMQCYQQIGISLSHNAAQQAYAGIAVSVNSMQPGDLIVMNYGSHVGMYIGNGQIVHALNSRVGIKVESVSKLQYYHVDTVRRLIY
jgi:cell wall-associated NlpC family hydrolase